MVQTARLHGEDGKTISVKLESVDPQKGTFSFKRASVPADLGPLVKAPFNGGNVLWDSLMRLGEQALSAEPSDEVRLGLSLLDRACPLDADHMAPRPAEAAHERARRIGQTMQHGILPIQGPPGTGKTWLGAHLIADAIVRGQATGTNTVVAITANSHRVIDNLLVETADRCAQLGLTAVFGHVGGEDKVTSDPRIDRIPGGADLAPWLESSRSSRPVVVGATKYALARQDACRCADVLVIDEAGQLPLADALALTQVAPVAIALGDPQQLAAPIQAAHEESVQVSLLEHLAGGHRVLSSEAGVFLDVSHRMHGDLCRVVADLAYDGELRSSPAAGQRRISGPDIKIGDQTLTIAPGVSWLALDGGHEQEVAVTLALIDALAAEATVTLEDGTQTPLHHTEIVVVAPHNAHVNRIAAQSPPNVRVGTVDKFQGQQGHVVIYSMGRLAETPEDVPFLYELNRLNVALSRARLLAIVISHREATFPPVAHPEHLMLASRFIRAVTGSSG